MFAGVRGAYSRFFMADGFFMAAGLAFFFLVTMIPLVLLSVSIVGFVLTSAFYWFQVFVLAPAHVPRQWLAGITLGFSLLLSVLMFYLGYRYVPVRHMRARPALAGAIVAALLWEVAKQSFRLYIRHFGV